MKELIEAIAKALVDHPDQVQVRVVEGEQVTVLELRVHPEDLGKVRKPPANTDSWPEACLLLALMQGVEGSSSCCVLTKA
jgi:hypothetical protein